MSDHITTPRSDDGSYDVPAPRARHRVRAAVLTGVAGALVLGGGGAIAYASGDGGSSTPSASASGSTGAPTGAAAPAAPNGATPPAGGVDAPKPGPHIDGTVTAVDGSTITVTDPDGFTRTIDTSSDTRYGDGLSSSPATGTRIHATGTVDSDKISLDATAIDSMPEPGKGPAGGPTPPTGTDAPAPPTGTDAPQPPTGTDAPTPPSGGPSAPAGSPSATVSGS